MDTIKQQIIKYLEEHKGWGGTLAREVREKTENKHKESIIERRARELYEAGIIDRDYEQVEGRGPKCVKYKLAPEPSIKPPNAPVSRETPKVDIFPKSEQIKQLSFN